MDNKKKRKKDTVKGVLLIILLIIIIVIVIMYFMNINTEKTQSEEFYQYYSGKRIDYEGILKISKIGDITELQAKDGNIQIDSTPIYYKNEKNKVLFPENMAKVTPIDNGRMTKINRFSNIYENQESIYLQSQNKNEIIENSFLYDGSDLYFFIEPTTLIVNEQEYELSPFSYIIVTYKDGVEIYNYDKDEYNIILTDGKVIAKTKEYTIDTTFDTIKYGNKEQLLLKNINSLPNE